VTRSNFERRGGLKWYPPSWRERYGDDIEQFLDDRYGDGPLPLSARLSMVGSGTVERLRAGGIIGTTADTDMRVRGASLLVLCAWGIFVVAGSAFAKYTEHWPLATPQADHRLPAAGMAAVQVAAATGALITILAGVIILPALFALVRSDGWRPLWSLARPMAVASAAAGAVSIGIIAWNGKLGPSTSTPLALRIVGILGGLVVVGALTVCCGTAVALVYRLRLSPRATRSLGALAVAMTMVLVVIFTGALLWWISTALHAPWFFGSLVPRSPATPAPLAMIVLGSTMLSGLVLAAVGTVRITTSMGRSHMPPAPTWFD